VEMRGCGKEISPIGSGERDILIEREKGMRNILKK